MIEVVEDPEGELNHEIEEIISHIEALSLTPAPRPPLVVSERDNNTEQSFKGRRRGFNMAFIVRRGRGGRRGGRSIANVEVMEVMQQITTRLEAMESRNQGNVDDEDASDPEIESPKEEVWVVWVDPSSA